MSERFHLVRPDDETHTYCGRRVALPVYIVRNPDDATCGTCLHVRDRLLAGLPRSEHGGLHPELRAMMTAGRAYLTDFRGEDERAKAAPIGLGRFYVDYQAAAYRLAADLHRILTYLEKAADNA